MNITHLFGVSKDTALPEVGTVEIVGYADDGKSIEALIVAIDGSTERPDGKTYHITWSLDREQGKKPVHSNNLIEEEGFEKIDSILIDAKPKFI